MSIGIAGDYGLVAGLVTFFGPSLAIAVFSLIGRALRNS